MKTVWAAILNYRSYSSLETCIDSLLSSQLSKEYGLSVVVVDAEYQEREVSRPERRYPSVTFIREQENLGYSRGYNLGLRAAVDAQADLTLLITPDVVVEPTTVQKLLTSLELNKGISVVGPKILLPTTPPRIYFVAGELDPRRLSAGHIGYNEIDRGQYDGLAQTDFVNGSVALMRTALFREVGYLDERYFLYYEDIDWSVRVKKAGYEVAVNSKAIAYHNESNSVGKGSAKQEYYTTRNLLLFVRKFASPKQKLIAYLLTIKELTGKIPLLFSSEGKRIGYKYIAVMDSLLGKSGYKRIDK